MSKCQTFVLPARHSGQIEIDSHPARFKVAVCGRRWGKTRCAVLRQTKLALEGKRCWWVAPTADTTAIAWRLARQVARQVPGGDVRESERCIRYASGGEMWFRSAEGFLRGEGLDDLVMDEADFIQETVWTEDLRPALSDRKGSALFISTPNVEDGWFHRLFRLGQSSEPEWVSWQFPSWTNPYLDPAEIEAVRNDPEYPSISFRREYGAEFVSAEGARIRREWIRYGSPPEGCEVTIGVDLAISLKTSADFTACVAVARSGDDRYIVDAARCRETFDGVLQFIRNMARKHGATRLNVESVQYQAAVAQALKREGFPVFEVHPSKDKVTRFLPVEGLYEHGCLIHAPSLPPEFEQEILGFPVAAHDDWADALAYAALDVKRNTWQVY